MDNEEVLQQEQQAEPIIISTDGKWEKFEILAGQQMEVGKTYHIKARGKCEFMISEKKPTMGIATNEITYTKQKNLALWIKTGV